MPIAALRAETDAGGAIDAVMERNRVFFREKTATARAVRTWSPERIAVAIDRIRTTERAIMAPATAGDILAEQRSEEHTSELQSLMRISYAVFCLKKKKNNNQYNQPTK